MSAIVFFEENKGYEPAGPAVARPPSSLEVFRPGRPYPYHTVSVVGILTSASVTCVCGMGARGQWNAVAEEAANHLRTARLLKPPEKEGKDV